MDFRRNLIDDKGIVSAEALEDGSVVLTLDTSEKVQVKMDKQEAFEIAFSLLCLAQQPDDIDVVIDLAETNLDNEEQKKNLLRILHDIGLYLGEE